MSIEELIKEKSIVLTAVSIIVIIYLLFKILCALTPIRSGMGMFNYVPYSTQVSAHVNQRELRDYSTKQN